jgi:predicted nucleotidyltransferase
MPPSRWRDDAAWQERVDQDLEFLAAQLGEAAMETLRELRRLVEERFGGLDFLVVFGSQVDGTAQPDSDIDLCFEASWVPPMPDKLIRIREEQDGVMFDLMGFPRGLFRTRLEVDDEFAHEVAAEGRIYLDSGSYRESLIALDERAG